MPSENTGHELTALSHLAISSLLRGTSRRRSVGSCQWVQGNCGLYAVLARSRGPPAAWLCLNLARASRGPADAHGFSCRTMWVLSLPVASLQLPLCPALPAGRQAVVGWGRGAWPRCGGRSWGMSSTAGRGWVPAPGEELARGARGEAVQCGAVGGHPQGLRSGTFTGAAHESETACGVGPGPRRW